MNIKLYSDLKYDDIVKVPHRKKLQTGIKKIDDAFGFPTGFYIITGQPGTGKGFLSLWLSRVFWENNNKTSVFFSLEMPETLVRQRVLQSWSDLTKISYQRGGDVTRAVKMLTEDMFTVDEFYQGDSKLQTPENFEKLVDQYYSLGFKIFHFDHLHELDGASSMDFNQKITEKWAITFQKICKKYDDIWLFVFAQPNSASAQKVLLRRTDIYGSKAITQKCDYFFSLNRKIDIDDNGIVSVDELNREVFLFLDKTRYTDKTHIAFKLRFSLTGNFENV